MYHARRFSSVPPIDVLTSLHAHPIRPTPSSRALWLYGNGKLAKLAGEFFAAAGQEVAGTFVGAQIAPCRARVAVAIITWPYVPIQFSLEARGCEDIWPVYDVMEGYGDCPHPLRNGWYATLTPDDTQKVEAVYAGLADDYSRAHYMQFLAWRLLREEWT